MQQKCQNCRFCVDALKDARHLHQVGLICRRNAPAIHDGRTKWPRVNPIDWCGQWESKTTSDVPEWLRKVGG
jgi:hypothetical protein